MCSDTERPARRDFIYAETMEKLKRMEAHRPKSKNRKEHACAIYMMTSPSGKSYIGYTSQQLWLRLHDHMEQSIHRRSYVGNAMRKYRNFDTQWEIKVLCWADNEEEARRLEEIATAKHDTFPNGYNQSPGGEKGTSDTTSIRIRKSHAKRRANLP